MRNKDRALIAWFATALSALLVSLVLASTCGCQKETTWEDELVLRKDEIQVRLHRDRQDSVGYEFINWQRGKDIEVSPLIGGSKAHSRWLGPSTFDTMLSELRRMNLRAAHTAGMSRAERDFSCTNYQSYISIFVSGSDTWYSIECPVPSSQSQSNAVAWRAYELLLKTAESASPLETNVPAIHTVSANRYATQTNRFNYRSNPCR